MKNKILTPILLALAALFGLLVGILLNFPSPELAMDDNDQREQKLRQIIKYINFEYVDNVNTDSLLDLTINDLLRRLDPHSTYIPLEEVAANEESIRGSFEGIGIEFRIYRDTLTVVHVLEGGPSHKAGIKAGDRILYADNVALFGTELSSQKIIDNLKGVSGSEVELTVKSYSNDELQKRQIKRGKVPLKSVQTAFMAGEKVGYIKLIRFSETSKKEVNQAISKLKGKGARQLILDLRDNPGGLLSAARDVADQFLEKNKLIVFTLDREGKKNEIFSTGKGRFEEGALVILINESSASASEIVAGAIQDNDRGVIIGRRSFGKGLVQEEITLNDGSKMRLTTQRYYTPTGRSIQKPYGDYNSKFMQSKGYDKNVPYQDSASIAHNEFTTPNGRKVYGGGGITPDVEVPFDTSRAASIVYHLSILSDFDEQAFQYVDNNRKELSRYSQRSFISDFEVDSLILQNFIHRNPEALSQLDSTTFDLLQSRIKAMIGYNLFGNEAYVKAYFTKDPVSRKALEILEEGYSLTPSRGQEEEEEQ